MRIFHWSAWTSSAEEEEEECGVALIVSILDRHLICFSRRLNELAAWEEAAAEDKDNEEAYKDIAKLSFKKE